MTRRGEVTESSYIYSERPPGFVFRKRRAAEPVLCCEDVLLPKLAERYGTPLYVYSAATIRERLAAFENAFPF